MEHGKDTIWLEKGPNGTNIQKGLWSVEAISRNKANGTYNEGPGEVCKRKIVDIDGMQLGFMKGNNRLWIVRLIHEKCYNETTIYSVLLWTWRNHLTDCPEK